ncbi:MAG: 3-phosphoshikimate 1-carboxyvinyltransferase [Clostridia bacterium]|nr:3-phosphoshikimate 1-carboxyvinyltransferase [Clostridia bacterium]
MNRFEIKNGISFGPENGTVTLLPGARYGVCSVPSSKSQAHRLLICASLSEGLTKLGVRGGSADINATVSCLRSLGTPIEKRGSDGIDEYEAGQIPAASGSGVSETRAVLDAGESGSTLRFLVPVVCALGIDTVFKMAGRLPERPMGPLENALISGGASIERNGNELHVRGRLSPGAYTLPGNVSSQFISGMLFALPLLSGESTLTVTGGLESSGYVKLTENALKRSGIVFAFSGGTYTVPGKQKYRFATASDRTDVEGDWSGAAFMLCMGAASEKGITVKGLDPDSAQGDKRIIDVLRSFGADVSVGLGSVTVKKRMLHGIELNASEIPDMVPAVAALAAISDGTTRITGASRLRLKESDRIRTTAGLIKALGGNAYETDDGLVIEGSSGKLPGGNADPSADHRIAMAAAVAASGAAGPVTVTGAGCVSKSFPGFWEMIANDLAPEAGEGSCENDVYTQKGGLK